MKGDTERETKEKEANKSDGLKHRSGWLENVKKLQKLCRIHNIICQFSPATFKFRGTMTFSTVCFSLLAVANANNWLQLGNKFRLCHFTVSQKSVNRSSQRQPRRLLRLQEMAKKAVTPTFQLLSWSNWKSVKQFYIFATWFRCRYMLWTRISHFSDKEWKRTTDRACAPVCAVRAISSEISIMSRLKDQFVYSSHINTQWTSIGRRWMHFVRARLFFHWHASFVLWHHTGISTIPRRISRSSIVR